MAETHENKPHGQKRRRKKKKIQKISALPFIIVCAVIILSISLIFRVGEFEILGSTVYTDEEIINASGIQDGDSLLFLNLSGASSGISSELPAIGLVEVDRQMPNKIVITVEESEAIAYIRIDDSYYSVDKGLRVLENISESDIVGKIELRGMSGITPIIGTQLGSIKADDIVMVVDMLVRYDMLKDVTWIDSSGDGEIEFDYEGRFDVVMPLGGDLDYNFRKLLTAVSKLAEGDRAKLDLTIDENVHFYPQ